MEINSGNPLVQENSLKIKVHINHYSNRLTGDIAGTTGETRIRGARIYWTKRNEVNLRLFMDIDFIKGYRLSPIEEWRDATWIESSTRKAIPNSSTFATDGNNVEYLELPNVYSYYDLNGHNNKD